MDEKQRTMLLDLISGWAGIGNDIFAAARMEEVRAGSGHLVCLERPTTIAPDKNGTSYYRIQGPSGNAKFEIPS